MQSSKKITNNSLKDWPKKSQITINSNYLKTMQRRVALVTVLIPFLGSLFAIWRLWSSKSIGLLEIGLLVGMYIMTMLGISVGFHRHFAHCSFKTKTFIRVILAILGSMAVLGPIIHWVSTHRRHHSYSDQLDDPHSPNLHNAGIFGTLRGFWHAHIGWFFTAEVTNTVLFSKDMLRDPVIFKINKLYYLWVVIGLCIPAVLGGILSWTWMGALNGVLWGGFVRIFLAHHVAWSITSIMHMYGLSPFETGDKSKNNVWFAIPTLGEAWHNNHHAFPGSAIFGLEKLQIDPGGWVIHALESAGLAWDVKVPTMQRIQAKKTDNDVLTLVN